MSFQRFTAMRELHRLKSLPSHEREACLGRLATFNIPASARSQLVEELNISIHHILQLEPLFLALEKTNDPDGRLLEAVWSLWDALGYAIYDGSMARVLPRNLAIQKAIHRCLLSMCERHPELPASVQIRRAIALAQETFPC